MSLLKFKVCAPSLTTNFNPTTYIIVSAPESSYVLKNISSYKQRVPAALVSHNKLAIHVPRRKLPHADDQVKLGEHAH